MVTGIPLIYNQFNLPFKETINLKPVRASYSKGQKQSPTQLRGASIFLPL